MFKRILNILCVSASFLMACGPVETSEVKYVSGAYRGGESSKITHGFLTEEAVALLEKDKSFSSKERQVLSLFRTQLSGLQTGVDMPDADETFPVLVVPTMKGHFYHFQDHTNYLGESSPTAMTEFLRHNDLAKEAYANNETSTFIDEVGRATHYLEDICVPFHATNKIAGLSWHVRYEAFVNEILLNEPAKLQAKGYEKFDSLPYGDLIDKCATKAASVIDLAEATLEEPGSEPDGSDTTSEPNFDSWEQAAKVHVPYTVSIVAAYYRKVILDNSK